MQFPFLSVIIFTPLAAGLILLLVPAERKNLVRWISLAAAIIVLGLSAGLYASYDINAGGYQFIERIPWLPALGITYAAGVDGISMPMVLMAALVIFSGVLVSWNVEDRPREFYSFLMFLGASVLGVFCSLDLFMLFFFSSWLFSQVSDDCRLGLPKTREYGGMKLTLYLFIGSVLSLIGALAVYFGSGLGTFDLLALEALNSHLPSSTCGSHSYSWICHFRRHFPFHSWAPDGHVAAPTAISMLLAGVEMKVGAFAALRVGIMLLPEGAHFWAPVILALATVNVVYGAFIALIQTDFKYVIGFSSVSHGIGLIGFATLSREGLIGAGMQMFSHGLMTDFSLPSSAWFTTGRTREILENWEAWYARCPGQRLDLSSAVWCRWACRDSPDLWLNFRSSWAPGRPRRWWRSSPWLAF